MQWCSHSLLSQSNGLSLGQLRALSSSTSKCMEFVELNDIAMPSGTVFLRTISKCYWFDDYLNTVHFIERSLKWTQPMVRLSDTQSISMLFTVKILQCGMCVHVFLCVCVYILQYLNLWRSEYYITFSNHFANYFLIKFNFYLF